MTVRIKNTNADILRQCREQMRLTCDEVQKAIKITISHIESGELSPTIKQLDKLGELYGVPPWVFIAESLPEQYQFTKSVPAFNSLLCCGRF